MCGCARKSDRKTSSHSSLFANLPVIIEKKIAQQNTGHGKVLTLHGERYRFILEIKWRKPSGKNPQYTHIDEDDNECQTNDEAKK